MKVGESRRFPLTFPGGLPRQGRGRQDRRVRRDAEEGAKPAHMPEVDAEFAKSLGMADGDLDKMRSEITSQSASAKWRQRLKARTKDSVMDALIDSHAA